MRGKKRLSIVWWILCAFTAFLSASTVVMGFWIAATKDESAALYFFIVSPFMLGAAGIFATLATHFGSEE